MIFNLSKIITKNNLLIICLLISFLLLLLPKIILIDFFSARWIDTGGVNFFNFLLQDIILVMSLFGLSLMCIFNGNKRTFLLISSLLGLLLMFLMLDMRVRELWLKPINLDLIKYSLSNYSDLISGYKIFFNFSAGLGFTFRFWLFIVFFIYFILIFLIGVILYKNKNIKKPNFTIKYKLSLLSVFLVLLLLSVNSVNVRYDLDKNIIIDPFISILKPTQDSIAKVEGVYSDFEQQIYSSSEIKKVPVINTKYKYDFENLVIVILESVRWKSVFDKGVTNNAPVLQRLANEGMQFKSYVSVPHSSKGYYAVLLGKHAYPDIEIKEAMPSYQGSFIHDLRKEKNMEALAFSSLNYQFENMGGFLKSVGVSDLYSIADIMPKHENNSKIRSSFGISDQYIYSSSIPYLKDIKRKGRGFISLYFPTAAHYPYNCDVTNSFREDIEKYHFCIQESDRLIGEMLDKFGEAGLIDSTLFVFVGDHGESFGEHNLFIHNSSMYEEEVTVPLVFWAAKKKLSKNNFINSQQIDIAPTIADFFNILDSSLKVQGKSLLREQGKRSFFMSTFFSGLSSALVEHPFKYIYEHGADTVIKFNLEFDPNENKPITLMNKEGRDIKKRISEYHQYQKNIFSDN